MMALSQQVYVIVSIQSRFCWKRTSNLDLDLFSCQNKCQLKNTYLFVIMKICSDVDGVILDYIQGFIDFTKRKKISYSHDPELYGVIRNFPNNEEIRDQFHSGDDLRLLNYFDDSLKILNTLATEH